MGTMTLHSLRDNNSSSHFKFDDKHVKDWFAEASGSELKLKIVDHRTHLDRGVYTFGKLQSLANNILPEPTTRPVNDIAILFCPGSWSGEGLYGLMFDYDAPGFFSSYNGVPRQACAIFLDEFDSISGEQQVWTAIHELGHVFNLIHDDTNSSFMATDKTAIGVESGFTGYDCDHLAAAGRGNYEYAAGGDNFKGGTASSLRHSHSTRWALRATSGKDHYLVGESIVLDLGLYLLGGVTSCVPRLDPGYPSFKIWIETPDGERIQHHTPLSFCGLGQKPITVAVGTPLENNPRLTLNKFKLNFSHAGVYKISADYYLEEDGKVVCAHSNTVEAEITRPKNIVEESISSFLRKPEIARFVNYKGVILKPKQQKALQKLADEHPDHESVQHVRYALAHHYHQLGNVKQMNRFLKQIKVFEESLCKGIDKLLYRARS